MQLATEPDAFAQHERELAPEAADAVGPGAPHAAGDAQHHQTVEPPGLIEAWAEREGPPHLVLRPAPVVLADGQPEGVIARRQVCVERDAARVGINPVCIEPFEPVAEAGLQQRREFGRGVLDLQLGRARRQRVALDAHVVRAGFVDGDERRQSLLAQGAWVGHRDAAAGDEPERSVWCEHRIAIAERHWVAGQAVRRVVDAEAHHVAGRRHGANKLAGVEADDAAGRGQPQILPAVLRDGVDAASREAVGVAREHEVVAAVAAQSVGAADPDRARGVLVDVVVRAAAESGVAEGAELARLADDADAGAVVRDPEVARAVDEDGIGAHASQFRHLVDSAQHAVLSAHDVAGRRHHPCRAVAVRSERFEGDRARHAHHRCLHDRLSVDAVEPRRRHGPQPAGAVATHSRGAAHGHARGRRLPAVRGAHERDQAVDGAGPDAAVGGGVDGVHEAEVGPRGDAMRHQPVDPFGGAGPDVPVAVFEHRTHRVAG